MLDIIATPVYAQGAGGTSSAIMSMVPFVLIFVIMYFMMIRPQQKKMKEHKAMVEALKRGDRVVALGGLVGTISNVVNETEVDITVGTAELRVLKTSINQVVSKSVEEKKTATDKKAKMKVVSNLKKK